MRWLRGLSIRTRITIGTLVIALIGAGASAYLLDLREQAIIHETTVQLLGADSAPFEAAIRSNPRKPHLAVGEEQLVAVVSPSGASTLTNLPDSLRDIFHTLETYDDTPRYTQHDNRQFLVQNESVRTSAGTWHIIVARSLEPGNLVLGQLRFTLLIGAAALVLIFGLASWILSGVALRPVSRMRRQAELLDREERPSGESLPIGPARDELAALALTLNAFLARNQQMVDRERQMISDASHELRTPLAVLSAQLDEAATIAGRGKDARKEVERAKSTARRLSSLATNLLELSRLEAGIQDAASSWSELSLETSAAIDRARILGEARNVLVDFDISDADQARDYPVAVPSFGRAIDNLLTNAITASPGGSSVALELRQEQRGLVLSVTDQGPGMPADFVPIAFDRFTRPDEARARDSGGSGLGLAIVAAIVSAAHGTADLRNLAPGFSVTVRLPELPKSSRRARAKRK